MREIKFRAWHKENKSFIGFWGYGCYMYENGQIYSGNMNITNRIELLQFTGLKDKNNIEIFEGDLVKFGDKIFQIKWSRLLVGFVGKINNEHELFACYQDLYEVIGNIYENPELLEQKKTPITIY